MPIATLNRSKALEYAHEYWNSFNPLFHHYSNDCTNFISQCWNAGGIPMTPEWHGGVAYIESHPGFIANTPSWVDMDAFCDYMTNSSSLSLDPIAIIKWSSTEVQPGDIIQFWSANESKWSHSGIISSINSPYGITYSCHSDPHWQRPLSDVYPTLYSEVRFICPVYSTI